VGSVDSTRPRIQHISKRLGAKSDVYDCLGYSFQATEVTAWGGHAVPEECHKPLPTRRPEKSLMLLPYSLIRPYSARDRAAEYCDERVCLFGCVLSVCDHIFGTAPPIFTIFVHATYGRRTSLLWRRIDVLCTSGFVDNVVCDHKPPS